MLDAGGRRPVPRLGRRRRSSRSPPEPPGRCRLREPGEIDGLEFAYLSTTGVFQLPKASAAVLTVGARVAWDNTAKEVTTPAAGRIPIGVAVEAAGNDITSVAVRLDGIATAAA